MDLLTHHLQSMADNFDFAYSEQWLEDYIDIPVMAAAAYLFLVLYVPEKIMKHREAFNLRGLNLIWNLGLTVFSFIGAYYCVPRLIELLTAPFISNIDSDSLKPCLEGNSTNCTPSLTRHIVYDMELQKYSIYGSFDTTVCVNHKQLYRRGIPGLLCITFMFSKIPEMIDTVFLVLQKKPLNFLHWYHHTTVMLYCWHAWITPVPSGIWFATMNYCVHSVMYFYYFLASCGYQKKIRPFAPIITFLQIAQMVMGTYITVHVFVKENYGEGCDISQSNTKLGLLMYASYFYLFSVFFVNRYLRKKPAGAKKNAVAAEKKKE